MQQNSSPVQKNDPLSIHIDHSVKSRFYKLEKSKFLKILLLLLLIIPLFVFGFYFLNNSSFSSNSNNSEKLIDVVSQQTDKTDGRSAFSEFLFGNVEDKWEGVSRYNTAKTKGVTLTRVNGESSTTYLVGYIDAINGNTLEISNDGETIQLGIGRDVSIVLNPFSADAFRPRVVSFDAVQVGDYVTYREGVGNIPSNLIVQRFKL